MIKIPSFVDRGTLRVPANQTTIGGMFRFDKLSVQSFIKFRSDSNLPIKHSIHLGGPQGRTPVKMYRPLDIIVAGHVDGMILVSHEEFNRKWNACTALARAKIDDLEAELNALRNKANAVSDLIALERVAAQVTGKTLLREDEIVAAAKRHERSICGVYFLVKGDRVVYVGQSTNLSMRIASHATTKDFDSVAYVPCLREDLDLVESLYIHVLRPCENGTHISGLPMAPMTIDSIIRHAH